MFSTALYSIQFQQLISHVLNMKRGGVSTGRAFHKPVLILSILDLLEKEHTTPEHISINEDLYQGFQSTWRVLLPEIPIGDFFQPVLYLPNDGFWSVYDSRNQKVTKKFTSLKNSVKGKVWSCFNLEYQVLIKLPEIRDILRMVILDTYFPSTKDNYWSRNGKPDLIAKEEALFDLQEPNSKYIRQVKFVQFEGFVRDWKFRENVLRLYDYSCCISGLRAQMGLSHPLVDACHIISHAESGINHPSNGLALCKNLHAAFDSGLIALSDDYKILVNRSLKESATPYSLTRLKGQKILLPLVTEYQPGINHIQQHRKNWGF